MGILQSHWYNFLVDTLSLDRSMFQLWLPAAPIGATDEALWITGNVIPPSSLTFNRAMSKVVRLSDQYASVARQMERPALTLAHAIGEPAALAWSSHLAALDLHPTASELPALFREWAARRAIGALSAGVGFLSRAALAQPAAQPASFAVAEEVPAFSGGYAEVLKLVSASPGAAGTFDSRIESADVGQAWSAEFGSVAAGLWIDSDSAALHDKFATSHITASGAFGAFAHWIVVPGGWYQSSVLATAFGSAASPPWRPDAAPGWQDFFAPGGSFRRAVASLVIVDAVDITLTSDAGFNPAEQQRIQDRASSGLWPLYAPAGAAVGTKVSFARDGGMSMRMIIKRGHPLVLGANVLGISRYLGRAD